MIKNNVRQQGQVGLIILLIMVVLLTLGVSMASRSVTGLKISRQEAESTRSLNLAEAGIETILADINTFTAGTGEGFITIKKPDDVNYKVTSANTLENIQVAQGHTLEVMLDDGLPGGSKPGPNDELIIEWELAGGSCVTNDPAIEVTIINDQGPGYEVEREAVDTCAGRRGNNEFDPPTGDPLAQQTVELDVKDVVARIKVLYTQTRLSVRSDTYDLPTQVYTVKTWATLADGTTRAVQVNKLGASLPSIFDYVVFSGNTLVK